MSRIGKQPIALSDKVNLTIEGSHVVVKGPKGQLEWDIPSEVALEQREGALIVKRLGDTPRHRAMHGLARALINNMVHGVTQGFEKRLEINGVGYRAQVSGKKVILNVGYSHPVEMPIPEGLTAALDADKKNVLVISGIDKQLVGEFAANIRKQRPPEPYKGKGIRYIDEHVQRKAGKAAAAK